MAIPEVSRRHEDQSTRDSIKMERYAALFSSTGDACEGS